MARWRASNPRPSPHHGLSPEQIAARLAAQGGACGLCGDRDARKWHGDHDHTTGLFRAVLCGRCNMGLGLFLDDATRVRRAAEYLERHRQLQALL